MTEFKKIKNNGILTVDNKKIIFNADTLDIGYSDLSKSDEELVEEFERLIAREEKRTIEKSKNLMLRLLLTANCNLKCEYCQMRLLNNTVFKEDIGYCDLDEIIRKIANSNYDFITIHFSGGEPLLAIKKIRYLAEKLKKYNLNNIKLAISTNGLLMTDDIINTLKEYDIQTVVSIDGNKEMNKKRVTKREEESFDSVLNSLKGAADQGLNIGVSMVYTNQNEELKDFINEMISKYHIKSLGFNYLHYSGFQRMEDQDEYMEKYADFLFEIYKICRQNGVFEEQSNRMLEPIVTKIPRTKHCSSQSSQVTVAPNKTISPCKTFCSGQRSICNLSDWINETKEYKETFAEWYKRSNNTIGKCNTCLVKNMCGGGCGYEAYVDNGVLSSPDSKYCVVPHKFLERTLVDLNAHGVFDDCVSETKLLQEAEKQYLLSCSKVKQKKLTTSIGHYLEN